MRRSRSGLLLGISLAIVASLAAHPADARRRGHRHRARAEPVVPPLTPEGLPNIRSVSALAVDMDTGNIVYSKNPDAVRAIASTGKIYVALVARRRGIDLEGITEITMDDVRFARGGSRTHLSVGQRFRNHDLLRAMLISSDNRACTALGRAVGWSPKELVGGMNAVARKLGLKLTHFDDPSGLNGNVSTARELVVALRAALEDPVIAEILATPQAVVRSVDKNPVEVEYISTDVALRTEKRFPILGGKTGYTDEAKYCLAIAAKLDGRRLGMAFLGADGKLTRFGDFNRSVAWLQAGGDKALVAAKAAAANAPKAAP